MNKQHESIRLQCATVYISQKQEFSVFLQCFLLVIPFVFLSLHLQQQHCNLELNHIVTLTKSALLHWVVTQRGEK